MKPRGHTPDPCSQAIGQLHAHTLLGPVAQRLYYYAAAGSSRFTLAPGAVLQIQGRSCVWFNDDLRLNTPQWLALLSWATLTVALGAPRRWVTEKGEPPDWPHQCAAQLAALHWWRQLRLGELPEWCELPAELIAWGRLPLETLAERMRFEMPDDLRNGAWSLTRAADRPLLLPGGANQQWVAGSGYSAVDHEALFAEALVEGARQALQQHHVSALAPREGRDPNSAAARAKRWLITHYPLLGSLLTQFDLVEDVELCRRMDIAIAAIHVGTGEIYVNPARGLSFEEAKFVLAHEVLHAGLNHASRRQGRDPYLWNVACDFVINDWLVGMSLGVPPPMGLLYDEDLRGRSADDIYLVLAADLRVRRRLRTLRGADVDLLDDDASRHGGYFSDREDFCRRALAQGLDFHQASGRGLLPEGLVEAIRTLAQPPIPWQAALAEWMQEHFPLPERLRSYARPSRRQAATPEIPRPRFVEPLDARATRTFGVIVDSSGSMQRADLGMALGAIVSYARAQGVRQVRLVYCDAAPYDEGFVDIESLAERARVRGRGGTVLQVAVNFLLGQKDFPKDAPVLVVTDGACEADLTVAREHAYLLAPGGRLPFVTAKPVFAMKR